MGLDADIVKAVKGGDLEKVQSLHLGGANLSTTATDSEKKRSLLHHASQRGFLDIAQYLLGKGLLVDTPDAGGKTPLYYAVEELKIDVVRFLVDSGADIHVLCDLGQTPLFGALNQKKIEATQILLDLGADVNHGNVDGVTPLMAIAHHESTEHLKLLLKYGAKPDLVSSYTGDTALHTAALYGRLDFIKVMLAHGASRAIRNKNGQLAVDIARSRPKPKIVEMLG